MFTKYTPLGAISNHIKFPHPHFGKLNAREGGIAGVVKCI
jgi:hypothetical protein